MKRYARALALVFAFVMLFTACRTAPQGSGSGVSTATGDGSTITLRMIQSLSSDSRTKVLNEIIANYEAENPNIKIELISPPLEGADEKISQMMMAKQDLDIVEVREQNITQFSNNGWIIPLDDYVNSWDGKATLTAAAEQSLTIIGGKAYMIPSGFYQRCLFYRKDMLEAANVEVPTTYEELLAASIALTNAAENKYGYAFRGGTGGNQYAEVEMLSWIGFEKLADPNAAFYLKDGNGATIFTLPEAKEALIYHKDLYEKGSPSDSITWGFSEMVQGFLSGTTAFLIQDSEVIANCEAELSEDQWGVAPMPIGPSGESVSPNGYGGWGITSYTNYEKEAADFLLYLSNAENNTKYAKSQALIPIHSTAVEDSFFSEGPFSVYMDMAAEPDVYKFAMRPQMYEAFASYKVEIDQEFQKYLKGTITVDDLLAYLDKYWSDAYAQEGQLW